MDILEFDSREAASLSAADGIVGALGKRLDAQGEASLVVSGGSTPADCLQALAGRKLDWDAVHVVLSDERWVPPTDEASNEGMIRRTLLKDQAAGAKLLPMYAADTTAEARAADVDEAIRSLPFPFGAVLLGMGADGHFASLFPDAEALDVGLDPESVTLCMAVKTAASPHPRLSLTLSALSRADEIHLLIFGDDKRATLEQALQADSGLPVARLLRQKRAPVNVHWAP